MSSAAPHGGATASSSSAAVAVTRYYFCHQCCLAAATATDAACPLCHGHFLEEIDLPLSQNPSNPFFAICSLSLSPAAFVLRSPPTPPPSSTPTYPPCIRNSASTRYPSTASTNSSPSAPVSTPSSWACRPHRRTTSPDPRRARVSVTSEIRSSTTSSQRAPTSSACPRPDRPSPPFLRDCILPWLGLRNTCPECRFELRTEDEDADGLGITAVFVIVMLPLSWDDPPQRTATVERSVPGRLIPQQ
uniref:RING-type E3 ubiquitin transferase n=1 Tax=Ananas comosus var. bracteatus TaxID=296719 RepID=A0A6V7PIK9_ANACO|nr:unnamed protein product [Ananas comosus var. bracteatus]